MTDQPLVQVLRALAKLKMDYMLTGSYASNVYGKVRSTFDADLVIALSAQGISSLVKSMDNAFYLDSRSLDEIKESGGQFNAVHKSSGLKIDFYLLGSDPYSKEAFSRRRRHSLFGESVWVVAPEDLILAKLRWAKEGGSQRQIEDAQGVYQLQRDGLDLQYLRRRAAALSLSDLLEKL